MGQTHIHVTKKKFGQQYLSQLSIIKVLLVIY